MRHRARNVATSVGRPGRVGHPGRSGFVVALALVAGVAVAGCTAATATTGAPAATTRPPATPAAVPLAGPPGPDPACIAAKQAERTLSARQGKDQANQSALDKDFTNYAAALSAAASREKRPATAQAMYALASDFTSLVESQSGAAQLPDMSQVQKDGATFDKDCAP